MTSQIGFMGQNDMAAEERHTTPWLHVVQEARTVIIFHLFGLYERRVF